MSHKRFIWAKLQINVLTLCSLMLGVITLIVTVYGLPKGPAQLSLLVLGNASAFQRIASESLPLRMVWTEPSIDMKRHQIELDSCYVTTIRVINKGGTEIDWSRDVLQPVAILNSDGVFLSVISDRSSRSDPQIPLVTKISSDRRSVEISTDVLGPRQYIDFQIIRTGGPSSLSVDGRLRSHERLVLEEHGQESGSLSSTYGAIVLFVASAQFVAMSGLGGVFLKQRARLSWRQTLMNLMVDVYAPVYMIAAATWLCMYLLKLHSDDSSFVLAIWCQICAAPIACCATAWYHYKNSPIVLVHGIIGKRTLDKIMSECGTSISGASAAAVRSEATTSGKEKD